MIHTLAIALATTMILGQTENDAGPGYEHLKYFHARGGTWKPEGTFTGEPVSGHVSYDWMLNKNVLVAHWDFRIGSEPSNQSVEIIAWDAKEQKVKSWTLSADAANWSNTFAIGNQITGIRVDGVAANGDTVSATGISRTVNKDKWEIQAVVAAGISGEQGDYFAHFTRVDPIECDFGADECSVAEIKGLEPLNGRWRWTSTNEDGESEEFEGETRWVLGGKFQAWKVLRKDADGKTLAYMAFRGWDPATKKVKAWGFGDDGSIHMSVWEPANNGWTVTSVVTTAEGEVSERKTLMDTTGETPKVTVVDGPVPQTIVAERLP